jgi:hypothetical protein
MRGRTVALGLVFVLAGALASTAAAQQQEVVKAPIAADLYCSGTVTNQPFPTDTYLITGEQSNYKTTFQEGDYVYINKGSAQGAKVGDVFQVMRPVSNTMGISWFRWQASLLRAMGTMWEDEGRLRVVITQPNVSIAQIEESCNYIQRGDTVLPFVTRTTPTLKTVEKFDRFAPPSGKATAMIVAGKRYTSELGAYDIAYVNLGSSQGVSVGDYFRIFRYQDMQHENPYQARNIFTHVYGYGHAPAGWTWQNLPREVIGEAIVVRIAPNSSTVLITFSLREIYAGDYIEVE